MIPFNELARQVMYFVGKAILPNFLSYWLQDLLDHSEDSVFSIHYCAPRIGQTLSHTLLLTGINLNYFLL